METLKTGTSQNIIYIDYSSSGINASIAESSADPTNLSSIMLNTKLFIRTVLDSTETNRSNDDVSVRAHVIKSIERSLKANSKVWDELSKH